jgi:hypothetical protein
MYKAEGKIKKLSGIAFIALIILMSFKSTLLAATVTGTRTLPASYTPEQSITVSIAIDVVEANAPSGLIVVETLPPGWTVTSANPLPHEDYCVPDDGDCIGEMKWEYHNVVDTTITYTVSALGECGSKEFNGKLEYLDPANGNAETTETIRGGTQTVDLGIDSDGDGYTTCQPDADCDDNNPAVKPGAAEGPLGDPTCSDGLDNDCDESIDNADGGCAVRISSSPKNIDFGCSGVGQVVPKQLMIENTGNVPLVIQTLNITPPDNIFSISSVCEGATFDDGTACPASISFQPTSNDGVGTKTGEMTITAITEDGLLEITETVSLRGEATSVIKDYDSDMDCVPDSEDEFPVEDKIATPECPSGGNIKIDALTTDPDNDIVAMNNVSCVSDTDSFLNQAGKPADYSFPDGLVSFVLDVASPGAEVKVKITFPSLDPYDDNRYYKVDEDGFYEFENAVFDGNTVTLTLKDDGTRAGGDSRGELKDSVIIDPGGVASKASVTPDDDPHPSVNIDRGAGGGGGACFIATAAYGSYMADEVMLLREFRDTYLMTNPVGRTFVTRVYYRYSPPIADFIAQHELLRTASRTALAPVVYSVKHPFVFAGVLVTGVLAIAVKRRRKI